jgi:hypothetical protein
LIFELPFIRILISGKISKEKDTTEISQINQQTFSEKTSVD